MDKHPNTEEHRDGIVPGAELTIVPTESRPRISRRKTLYWLYYRQQYISGGGGNIWNKWADAWETISKTWN